MQAIEKIDTTQPQYDSVEYIQALQTTLGMLYLLFTKSVPEFHPEATLSSKKISFSCDRQFALFIAQVVNNAWDQYIEDQQKEAEITKAAAKKDRIKKDELHFLALKNEIVKQEIRHSECSAKAALVN
jgi:hypothetical protein